MTQSKRPSFRSPRVPRVTPPERHAPAAPEAAGPEAAPLELAALQRSLGNAAFGRMMSGGAPIARMPRAGGPATGTAGSALGVSPARGLLINRAPPTTAAPPAPAPAPGPAVPGAPGVAVAKAPDPGGVQLTHTGAKMTFSDNKEYVQYQLEKLVTTHNNGLDQLAIFENSDYGFKFSDEMGPQMPALGGATTPALTPEARNDYRKKVAALVHDEVVALKAHVSQFRDDFEFQAQRVLGDMLNDSQARLDGMKAKYGIKEESSFIFWTDYAAGKTDANDELIKAASPLLQKFEEYSKADKELQDAKATRGSGADEPDAGTEGKAAPSEAETTAQKKVFEVQGEYTTMLETQKAAHPILAVYNLDMNNFETHGRLKKLAAGDTKGMGQTAGKEIAEKLANIQKVRDKLAGDKTIVWKLDKVMEATKFVPPIENHALVKNRALQRQKIAEERGKQEAIDEMTTVAIGVVAFAVGMIAAAPVGAAVAAAAGGADAALAIAGTISAIQKYQFEVAAQGTDIDKAHAISQGEEPSLFWLALDIAGSVIAVKGGLKAGRALFSQVNTLRNEAIGLKAAASTAEAEGGTAKAALDGKLKQLEEAGNSAKPGDGAKLVEEVKKATTPATGAAKAMGELFPQLAKLAEMEAAKAEELVAKSITSMGMPATVEAAGGYAALEAKLGAQSPALGKIRAWRQTVLEEMATQMAERRAAVPAGAANPEVSIEEARKILARSAGMAPEAVEKLLGTELTQLAKMEKAADYALSMKHYFLGEASPRLRLNALAGIINPILEGSGVPAMFYQTLKKGGGAALDFPKWGMEIGVHNLADVETLLQKTVLTEQEFKGLVSVAYHEARHAEQWWLMARRLRGDGMAVGIIARKMDIPLEIAELAAKEPLKKGMAGAELAEKWIQSVYGMGPKGRNYRNNIYAMKDKFRNQYRELEKKLDELRKANAPMAEQLAVRKQWTEAGDNWRKWDQAYRELPEEADAYLAQAMFDKVMGDFTAGAATARPKP